jgi:hypothetical protein
LLELFEELTALDALDFALDVDEELEPCDLHDGDFGKKAQKNEPDAATSVRDTTMVCAASF